mgnify:CR=1 FL=1
MDYELISQTALFQGCSPSETEKLLHGLKTFTKKYKKGAPVYLAGTPVTDIGIVLYGTVQIENNDLWGNKNIISLAHTGEVFAEAYACVPGEPMMVDVIAMEEAEILFLNVPELFRLSRRRKRRIFASDPQYDDNQRTQKPAALTPHPTHLFQEDPRSSALLSFLSGRTAEKPLHRHSAEPPAACRLPQPGSQRPFKRTQ